MRKAVLKRFKITKTGKFLHRIAGQNHFNAKMSRRSQLRKHGKKELSPLMTKKFKQYLG